MCWWYSPHPFYTRRRIAFSSGICCTCSTWAVDARKSRPQLKHFFLLNSGLPNRAAFVLSAHRYNSHNFVVDGISDCNSWISFWWRWRLVILTICYFHKSAEFPRISEAVFVAVSYVGTTPDVIDNVEFRRVEGGVKRTKSQCAAQIFYLVMNSFTVLVWYNKNCIAFQN